MLQAPITAYTALDNIDIWPKIAATKSISKIPTNPQFNPPTHVKSKAITLNKLLFSIELSLFIEEIN